MLRIQGPAGSITGTVATADHGVGNPCADPDPAHPRTFRVGFPTQQLSGTYTLSLGSGIKSASGLAMDNNLNAGVDSLRGVSSNPPISLKFNSAGAVAIPAGRTVSSTIQVNDDFVLNGLTLQLNIVYPTDPDLTVSLIGPDGTVINLFTGVGKGIQQANFSNTIFDDAATTPVSNGGAPFFGRFRPQQLLGALTGSSSVKGPGGTGAGTYTLRITNSGTGTGTLTGWSLTLLKPVASTGLGELVADRSSLSYRVFTMDPTNPLASTTWTSVGPASSASASVSSRIGGLAVDPSDPSGNTVYVGGASGGIWKTTNFLTTDPNGPTYIPLTDFGPTFGINIGAIAVFGRNNDPNQSVVVAATGEGDTASRGVGFLLSTNGGATWTLLDSTNNNLPVAQRDHAFLGSTAFKVIVDPRPTLTGDVIIYAALSGNNGGIWRSLDTGKTWGVVNPANGQRVANLPGQATDVTFDPNSGPVDAVSNPAGNLQVIYGAIRGQGVFLSPNQGQAWNLMAGGVGKPLFQDPSTSPAKPIPVNNQGNSPNGAKGRIVLAKPDLIPSSDPNAVQKNFLYQGWLFAYVATPNNFQDGLYVTKDNGQNWTKVRIPTLPPVNNVKVAIPSNDTGLADYDVLGDPNFQGQGNYDISITLDPTNPNIVYLGGFGSQVSGLVRVDITGIADPHVFYSAMDRPDGGSLGFNATDGVALKKNPDQAAITNGFINLTRFPTDPLGANATFYVSTITSIANTGAGVRWIPFDVASGDQHRALSMVDPLTGHARLIFGDDHGVFTVVDNGDGTLSSGIGTAANPSNARSGNLQITQFYYGAVQPSSAAAQIAGALFYGQAQDNGFPRSDPNVLNNGNIRWSDSGGDGSGVATDQTGTGTLYQYNWPCCGGNVTDFFQVNGVGRTNGLIQQSNGTPVPDPQWPFVAGFNFAVNPINGNQIVISSSVGRIFRTEDQGRNWFVIGDPSIFGNSNAPALAFGAPDPGATIPSSLDNFIYAGTNAGRIFVTFTGGGTAGSAWFDITNGALASDGSGVQSIITNPTRGSHEAYAVTSRGAYYISDSRPASGATWQNITSNLFQIQQNPFGNTAQATPLLNNLTSIQADWRYVIPDSFSNPNGPTHPILFVAGEGGVFRSLDKGQTWSLFPSQETNSIINQPTPPGIGGGLPNARVTDLDMSIGDVDPTTGRSVAKPGDPNILVATTFGRGTFAIRLAPVAFASSLGLSTTSPAPGGSANGTASDGTPLSTVAQPVFTGLSEQTAFGNVVRISLFDYTDPSNPRFIGGYDGTAGTDTAANRTDEFGRFSVQVNAGAFTSNGLKTIGVQATDASGTKGNIATYTFTLQAQLVNVNVPPVAPTIQLLPADDSSGGLKITNVTNPRIVGVTDPFVTVSLFRSSGGLPTGPALATTTTDLNGNYTLVFPSTGDGVYTLQTVATNSFGSSNSSTLSIQIKTNAPTTAPTVDIRAADDTGIKGDAVTSNRTPHFDGTAEPLARVQLYRVVNGVRNPTVLATTSADASGNFSIQLPFLLSNGPITLQVGETDVAGNLGPYSTARTFRLVTTTGDYVGAGNTTPGLFRRDPSGTALWLIQGVGPAAGTPFGSSILDIPFSGDFDGNGFSDLAYYRPSTNTWTIRKASGDSTFAFGSPGEVPVAADFDGLGITEVGSFNRTTGGWSLATAAGVQTFSAITTPQAGDIPVPADYDGNGTADLAVFRPSTGAFFIQTANGLVTLTVKTAANAVGDQPVPGEYDNTVSSRKAEPAVYNPTTGKYTILPTTFDLSGNLIAGTARSVQFQPDDVPNPGDYLGTGSTQPAVVRPQGPGPDIFIVANGSGGTTQVTTFGASGDIPVLSPLVYRNAITITPSLALAPSSDTGFKGDGKTSTRRPFFTGTTDPGAVVDLIDANSNLLVGTGTADATGKFNVQFSPTKDLPNGSYSVKAVAHGPLGRVGPVSTTSQVRLVTVDNDFIGQGSASQALFRRTSSTAANWFINGVTTGTGISFGSGTLDVPLEGDLDGDGRVDMVLFRPSTGQFFARFASNAYAPLSTIITTSFTVKSGDVPLIGDFDGDGKASLAIYRPSTAQFFVNGEAAPIVFTSVKAGDVPVVADFENTGRDELAIYRPGSPSQWYINGDGGLLFFNFGGPTDVPVPGVYTTPTAGRLAQPAVYRPSTGEFFVSGVKNAFTKFAANDIPVPADYNGDGLTDPAVYRPGAPGLWRALQSPATTQSSLPNYGGPSDIPTVSPYRYRALPVTTAGKVTVRSVAPAVAVPVTTGSTSGSLTPAPAPSPTTPVGGLRRAQLLRAARAHARTAVNQANAVKKPGQLF
ncbi:MAG: Ig-like domain-containing protein [Isosphaeraceae bacterium]